EDYGAAPAPSLGAEYLLWQKKQAQVTVKGNASRSYRVPTLNERFWPTGDPHLKPESGFGYEAGVRFTNEKGAFTTTAEATVYQMQVQNWVQWQPVNDGWSPVNLQQVKSSGLEAAASVAYKQQQTHFKLSSAYYYTRSTQTEEAAGYAKQNQLIFVPLHSATTTAFISKNGWFANSQFTYTSSRYTNPSNTSLVEGFALLNAVAGKTVTYKTFQLELSAKVNNITNQVYQNMDYRAMPLRHYSLCLRITYNHQYKN
ncbi:MAG: TonB-dependent receptor, partial [Hymenobacteraceae bacterium]|nr:TonB-dependent receptor [Hymenobacteraceae bacterium]MDX5397239.1 TonB-dependent receptor [Hymenobacteraceae bacterium]MDX5513315.1 TonB-dependent receptor [Hymenobacteraceae bacterium]